MAVLIEHRLELLIVREVLRCVRVDQENLCAVDLAGHVFRLVNCQVIDVDREFIQLVI